MNFHFKKIFFSTIFNACLFTLLMIGLQNNSNKSNVNLIFDETVKLPIGFIVGTSFIAGSIVGNFFTLSLTNKK